MSLSMAAAACAPSGAPATTTPASATPAAPIEFSVEVLPGQAVGLALPGERFVFLVRASGEPTDGPVELSATSSAGTVSVEPASLQPGAVGEVTLVPAAVTGSEVPVDIEIAAERSGVRQTETRTILVQPGVDTLRPEADAHLAPFLTWLAANRPDLGITAATQWDAVPGTWVLIVSHYLYFSPDWELDLAWHVMIPPDDWSRINMRRRWSEISPSCAFEISSVSGSTPAHEIQPEQAIWR
jgi:hypothetical protein